MNHNKTVCFLVGITFQCNWIRLHLSVIVQVVLMPENSVLDLCWFSQVSVVGG